MYHSIPYSDHPNSSFDIDYIEFRQNRVCTCTGRRTVND